MRSIALDEPLLPQYFCEGLNKEEFKRFIGSGECTVISVMSFEITQINFLMIYHDTAAYGYANINICVIIVITKFFDWFVSVHPSP